MVEMFEVQLFEPESDMLQNKKYLLARRKKTDNEFFKIVLRISNQNVCVSPPDDRIRKNGYKTSVICMQTEIIFETYCMQHTEIAKIQGVKIQFTIFVFHEKSFQNMNRFIIFSKKTKNQFIEFCGRRRDQIRLQKK